MRLVLPPGVLEVPLAMLREAEPRLRDLLACTPLPAPAAARSLGAAWQLLVSLSNTQALPAAGGMRQMTKLMGTR